MCRSTIPTPSTSSESGTRCATQHTFLLRAKATEAKYPFDLQTDRYFAYDLRGPRGRGRSARRGAALHPQRRFSISGQPRISAAAEVEAARPRGADAGASRLPGRRQAGAESWRTRRPAAACRGSAGIRMGDGRTASGRRRPVQAQGVPRVPGRRSRRCARLSPATYAPICGSARSIRSSRRRRRSRTRKSFSPDRTRLSAARSLAATAPADRAEAFSLARKQCQDAMAGRLARRRGGRSRGSAALRSAHLADAARFLPQGIRRGSGRVLSRRQCARDAQDPGRSRAAGARCLGSGVRRLGQGGERTQGPRRVREANRGFAQPDVRHRSCIQGQGGRRRSVGGDRARRRAVPDQRQADSHRK